MKSSGLAFVVTILVGFATCVNADESVLRNQLPDRIEDLDFPDAPFERNLAFASLIRKIDEDKIVEWLDQSTQMSWKVKPKNRTDFQALLIRRLAEINPEHALEFALKRLEPNRSTMMSIVFFEWAGNDPDGAFERVKSLRYLDKREMLDSVFAASEELSLDRRRAIKQELGLGSRRLMRRIGPSYGVSYEVSPSASHIEPLIGDTLENPKKVWYEVIGRAKPNSLHYDDLTTVAIEWVNESGIGALDEVKTSLASYEQRKYVLASTLTRLIYSSPQEAFDYAIEHSFPGRNETIISMVKSWTRIDPVAALNRVHSLPSSGFRRRLERNVLSEWFRRNPITGQFEGDPALILDKLHLIPDPLQGDASAVAIERMISIMSPRETAEAVLRLNEESRFKAAVSLVKKWSHRDQEGAIEWIKTTPEVESFRNELLLAAAKTLVRQDPNLSFDIARSLVTPKHGFGPEGEIVSIIAGSEPRIAMELLPKVREGKTRLNAYVSVATQLILDGLKQEILDLGKQLSDDVLMMYGYYLQIGAAWAQIDPQGLVDSLENFPNDEVRSRVAAQQIRWNSATNFFSEQQIQSLRRHVISNHQDLLEAN